MAYDLGLFDKAKQFLNADGQTQEERDIAAHVRSKVEESRSHASRIAHEGIWMTNIAYLLGYDGIAFNQTTRTFQPVNRVGQNIKRSRIHVNKLLPTIQNRLAKLCKNPPKYDVRPESNDVEDKEAARLSLQVLSTMWEKLGLDQKRLVLYMWVQQCGHAWGKVSWDPSLGNPVVDPMRDEVMGFEGDVRFEVAAPFEVFPNPLAKSEEEVLSSWLIQAKVRRLEYFKLTYPEKGHLVKSEDAWLLSAQYEQRINSMNSRGPAQGGMTDQMKDSAIELVKYEARSKKHPRGRMMVVANGILLEDKPLPVGVIPFRQFTDTIIGGKLYAEAILTHLRPLQDMYNENERRIAAWVSKFLAGKYSAPRGSGLAQEALHDGESEVVYYDPVPNAPSGVQALQVPQIPQWAFNYRQNLNEEIGEISGISEVSKGQLPAAGIPAVGMQMLVEADDTRIGVVTEGHEHAWAGIGQLILKYVEAYWDTPRKIKLAGRSMAYTVKEVSGSMLRGNTDVFVIRGSTLPGSKTLKRQEVLNAWQQGLLGPQQDPRVIEKVLGMMEFGDTQDIWRDYGLDMHQIRRGIDMMEQGQPTITDQRDNHALWMQELNRYRKEEKWDTLGPEIQGLFDQAFEEHLQALLSLAQNQQQPMPPDPGPTPDQPMPPEGANPEGVM